MGDKKQKELMVKRAKQVVVIMACVLFVILMILSGMGSGWLSMFTVIKPGDSVVVDYTLYDVNGNPVMTTSQSVYMNTAQKGKDILYSKQLTMVPGQNLTKSIYPVTFYSGNSGSTKEFALFSSEYNAINQVLVGMKAGEQKRIKVTNSSMAQDWSAELLKHNGVDISNLQTGDVLAMGVSDNPEEMATNTSISYTRVGLVTAKTNESVTVDFGYPSADISIVSINNQ